MGREKNLKDNVSIYEDRTTLRLRWRHLSKWYSLNLFAASKPNLLRAKKIALIIEHDLISAHFDDSLDRYRELIRERVHKPCTSQKAKLPKVPAQTPAERQVTTTAPLKFLKAFDRYITAKSMNPDSEGLSSYYTQTKAMLGKWESFDPEDAALLLGKEPFGPKNFNDRRNCLFKFFKYLVRKGKLASNPMEDVVTKKRQRNTEKRKPFTEAEVTAILHTLKTDQFRKKCFYRSHAQYYPMVAFMVQTGVRNAEAIGLQVRDVLWKSN